jgi:hypothetical protein
MKVAPQETWSGLYINLTEVPQQMVPEHVALFANGRPRNLGNTMSSLLPSILGLPGRWLMLLSVLVVLLQQSKVASQLVGETLHFALYTSDFYQ